jgi:RHS repeat-associated protein
MGAFVRQGAGSANAWARSVALLGVAAVACGDSGDGAGPTETLAKVHEAIVDRNAPLHPGERRGARMLRFNWGSGPAMTDPAFDLAAHSMKAVTSIGSGTGAVIAAASYPASGYWIAHKNSPNQGEWVSHLLKAKMPPAPVAGYYNFDGAALWLTHSLFIPTGTTGPGGIVALDPPGLVNGQGFVQPAPEGGALLNPVVSAPGTGAEGTRWKWTTGPADTGIAVRVADANLVRIGILSNQIVQQSFLMEVQVAVPSHPERAGAIVGNAIRPLMFLQRGGQDLVTSGSGMMLQPVDFSAHLDKWVTLQVRADVTTTGGTSATSIDDTVRVKYRSYLEGELVHTEEPPVNTAVVQAQAGPLSIGPGFALLRGYQGDAPEAFIDELQFHVIVGPSPLRSGESLGATPWTETFGSRSDGAGESLSGFKFVPHNTLPDRSVRLYDPTTAQASGTTAIAYKGSANTEVITQHIPHFAPGANCTTNPLSADCRLPNGETFDGTAMWITHSRFVPSDPNAPTNCVLPGGVPAISPPPIGCASPQALGRRYDGTNVPADTGAYVRPADNLLFEIPFQEGVTQRKSYVVSADLYVPTHVGGHEWVRIVPYVRRGPHVDPAWAPGLETNLLGIANKWTRLDVRVDVTTHGGGVGSADDKAEIYLQYVVDSDADGQKSFGGAYVKLDAISGAGSTENLKFGVSYGIVRGWQLDALEAFIDNVSAREVAQTHTLCSIDTDCPTGQICTDESARVGLSSGTKFCWDMACGTSSSTMCGSTSSPCGLCPDGAPCASSDNCTTGTSCTGGVCSCGATCVGKACGASDGCGGTCYCGIGQTSCTSETPCETGFVCQSPTCGYTPIQSVALRPGEVRLAEKLIHLGASGPDAWDLAPYHFINHAAFGSGTSVRYSGNPVSGYRIAYKNHANRGDWVSHHLTPSPPPLGLPIQLGWYSHAAVWLSHSRFQSGATPAIGEPSPEQTGTPWIGGTAVSADGGTAIRFNDMASHRVPIVANQTTLKSFLIMSGIYVPAHAGARYGVRVSPYLARGGAPLTSLGGVGPRAIDFTNKHAAWNLVQVRADVSTHGGSTDGPTDDTMRVTNRFYLNGEEVGVPEVVDVSTDVLASHHGPVVISPSFGLSRGWEGDAPEAYIVVARMFELGHGARLAAGETLGAPLYTLTFNNTPESSSLTGTGILDRGFRGYGATSLRLFDGTNTQRSGRYIAAYKNSPQQGDWISHHFRTLVPSEDTLLRSGSLFDGTAMWLGHSRFLPSGEVVSTTPLVTSVGPPAIGLESAPATGTRWNGTVGPAEWGGNDARVTNDLMALATVPFTAGVTRRQSYLISMDLFVPKHVGAHASNRVQVPALIRRGDHNHQRSESLDFGALLDRWNRVDVRVDVPTHGSNSTDLPHDLAERDVQYFVNGKLMEGVSHQLDDGFLGLAPGQPLTVGPAFALSHGWFGAPPEAYVDNITMRPITSGPTACTSDAQCLDGGRVCVGGSCKDPSCARPNAPCRVCGPCGAGTACTGPDGCDPGLACANGTCACVPQCAGKGCGASDGCGGACECGNAEPGGVCSTDEDCLDGLNCIPRSGAHWGLPRQTSTCGEPGCGPDPWSTGCGYVGAPCGPYCDNGVSCDNDADCPVGEICGIGMGPQLGLPIPNVCVPSVCGTAPETACGDRTSPCGECACEPACELKMCGDDPADGCGGTCAGFCEERDDGCQSDRDCGEGLLCIIGGGPRVGLAAGVNVCLPKGCQNPNPAQQQCGMLASECGVCPPPPDDVCTGRECGVDPTYGVSCGPACSGGLACVQGQCVVDFGAGDLDLETFSAVDKTPITIPPLTNFQNQQLERSVLGALDGDFGISDRGHATYRIPIVPVPGRAGLEPDVALKFNNSSPNGLLGVGWSIDGLSSISRCPKIAALNDGWAQPVSYTNADALCLDGHPLVLVSYGNHFNAGAEYRTEAETFTKVTIQVAPNDGRIWFRAHAKDGRILSYGSTPDAVLYRHGGIPRSWALSRIEDRTGNVIRFAYAQFKSNERMPAGPVSPGDNGTVEFWPSDIAYGGIENARGTVDSDRWIRFSYLDNRFDYMDGYTRGGARVVRTKLLERIDTGIGDAVVRSYELTHEKTPLGHPAPPSIMSGTQRVKSIRECATKSIWRECKEPTVFTYADQRGLAESSAGVPVTEDGAVTPFGVDPITPSPLLVLDWNGDGKDDLLAHRFTPTFGKVWNLYIATGDRGPGPRYIEVPTGIPAGKFGVNMTCFDQNSVFDFNHDGRDDLLDVCHLQQDGNDGAAYRIWRSSAAPGAPFVEHVDFGAEPQRPDGREYVVDLNGDGVKDLFQCDSFGSRYYVGDIAPQDSDSPFSLVAAGETDNWGFCRHHLEFGNPHEGNFYRDPPPPILVTDIDGDGIEELLKTGGTLLNHPGTESHWARYVTYPDGSAEWVPVNLWLDGELGDAAANNLVRFIDVNGDDLKDVYALLDEGPVVALNLGGTFAQPVPAYGSPNLENARATTYSVRSALVLDHTGDGHEDLIRMFEREPLEPASLSARWQLDRGHPLMSFGLSPLNPDFTADAPEDPWVSVFSPRPEITPPANADGTLHPTSVLADADGDGSVDLLQVNQFGRLMISYGEYGRENLLTEVTDGMGKRISVRYERGQEFTDGWHWTHVASNECIDDDPESGYSLCVSKVGPIVSAYDILLEAGDTGEFGLERTVRQRYEAARRGLMGRGFLGFEKRVREELTPFGTLIERTVIEEDNRTWDSGGRRYAFAGRERERTVTTAPAQSSIEVEASYRRTSRETEWSVLTAGSGIRFTVPSEITERTEQVTTSGTVIPLVVETTVFDSIDHISGKVEKKTTTVDHPDGTAYITVTQDVYENRIGAPDYRQDWLLGLRTRRTVTDQVFDSIGNDTQEERIVDYAYDAFGQLESVTREPEVVDPSLQRITTYARSADVYYNLESVTSSGSWFDANGQLQAGARKVSFEYDADDIARVFPRHIIQHVVASSACSASSNDPASCQVSAVKYDVRDGTLLTHVDPNGIGARRSYDAFGRISQTDSAAETTTTTYEGPGSDEDEIIPTYSRVSVTTTSERTGERSIRRLDALGRVVQTQTRGFAGLNVLQEYVYWFGNRLSHVTRPHLPQDQSQGRVIREYDAAWRLKRVEHADGEETHFLHAVRGNVIGSIALEPGEVFVEGRVNRRSFRDLAFLDSRGKAKRTTDAQQHATRYTYLPFGELHVIDDPNGNLTTIWPDRVGRTRSFTDANTGTTTTNYTAFDEPVSETDAGGQGGLPRTTGFAYDDLGRLITTTATEGTNDPTPEVTSFDFDGSAAENSVGRLTETLSPDGHREVYSYEEPPTSGSLDQRPLLNRGFLTSVGRQITTASSALATFETSMHYNVKGQLERIDYPPSTDAAVPSSTDEFSIHYGYDDFGNMNCVSRAAIPTAGCDTTALWKWEGSYQGRRIGSERFGNGLTTTYGYDALTGRRTSIETRSGGALRNRFVYPEYDENGNLERREHTYRAPGAALDTVVVEEFTYDELDRLDDIETTRNGAADPLIDVNYDFLGNITSKTGVGNYEYLNASGAVDRPHLVKRIKDAANAVKATFEYDGVGNTTQRSGEGVLGGTQTFTYTPFDLPRHVTVGTGGTAKHLRYGYGANQRRVLLSIDTDGNTATAEEERVYAGDLYERIEGNDVGGDVTRHLYKVFAHGRRVAHVEREVRSGVSIEESRYVNADHLGSSSVLTDEVGDVVHVQRFDAFGAQENSAAQSADAPTRNVRGGYTGHEMDSEVGLVNMRGRIYDPRLGRFMQADPIIRPNWSQALNRYSYVVNNPLRWVDPTGLDLDDPDSESTYDHTDYADSEEEAEQIFFNDDPLAVETVEAEDWGPDDDWGPEPHTDEPSEGDPEAETTDDAQVDDATFDGERSQSDGEGRGGSPNGVEPWGSGGSEGLPSVETPESPQSIELIVDFVNGVESYGEGLGLGMAHGLAGAGVLGEDAKDQHDDVEQILQVALNLVIHAPGSALSQAAEVAANEALEHPGYILGRGATGVTVSSVVGPAAGLAVTAVVMYGNAVGVALSADGYVEVLNGAVLGR